MNPDDLNQYECQQEDMQGPPWWIAIPLVIPVIIGAVICAGLIFAFDHFLGAFPT